MSAERGLAVVGLDAWYGPAHILHGVDLAVAPGEAVALLGRNGAGKSTLIKAVAGLVRRRADTLSYDGIDLRTAPSFRVARAGIGFVPEDRRIFTGLTVAENLEVGRQRPRPDVPAWTPEAAYDLFPSLGAMRARRGGRMSGGEQQMLTIARTLMGNPSLLLLDEPAEGLAPLVVAEVARAITAMKAAGLSLILSEQNLGVARPVCDRVVVLEKGRVRFAGSLAAFEADERATAALFAP